MMPWILRLLDAVWESQIYRFPNEITLRLYRSYWKWNRIHYDVDWKMPFSGISAEQTDYYSFRFRVEVHWIFTSNANEFIPSVNGTKTFFSITHLIASLANIRMWIQRMRNSERVREGGTGEWGRDKRSKSKNERAEVIFMFSQWCNNPMSVWQKGRAIHWPCALSLGMTPSLSHNLVASI